METAKIRKIPILGFHLLICCSHNISPVIYKKSMCICSEINFMMQYIWYISIVSCLPLWNAFAACHMTLFKSWIMWMLTFALYNRRLAFFRSLLFFALLLSLEAWRLKVFQSPHHVQQCPWHLYHVSPPSPFPLLSELLRLYWCIGCSVASCTPSIPVSFIFFFILLECLQCELVST